MKSKLFLFLFLFCLEATAQIDTMIVYYNNGQLKAITPKLNGKPHGKSKMWYESGQIWSEGTWVNGKQIQTTMYHENGQKSYYVSYKKFKMKLKMWHPNGQLWTTSVSKYSRSIDQEFDSTGILLHKLIEKMGSSLSCVMPIESEISDSLMYKDGSCVCPWGNAYWRNGTWVDEKGRDLSKNYSYIRIDYFTNGKKKKESIFDKEQKKYFVREWDEKGILVSEGYE
jgi:antitoxin component YwqK of YwqJK toxin-antitoxin module